MRSTRERDPGLTTRTRPWRVSVAVAAVVLLGGLASAQDRGRCLTVDVPAPFVTPDHVMHQPGSLKLCVTRVHSPVSALHTLYVDGYPVCMSQSLAGRSEGAASSDPVVHFRWNDGRKELTLVGYAWPDGEHMRTHRLEGHSALRPEASGGRAALRTGVDPTKKFILVAGQN